MARLEGRTLSCSCHHMFTLQLCNKFLIACLKHFDHGGALWCCQSKWIRKPRGRPRGLFIETSATGSKVGSRGCIPHLRSTTYYIHSQPQQSLDIVKSPAARDVAFPLDETHFPLFVVEIAC